MGITIQEAFDNIPQEARYGAAKRYPTPKPNFPWGKFLFVLLFLVLLVGQCFSQITASEARENTLKGSLSHRSQKVLEMVETYSKAGHSSLKCCRHGMGDKTRNQLESLGYRVTERENPERLMILDRELYVISW